MVITIYIISVDKGKELTWLVLRIIVFTIFFTTRY